VPLKVTYQGQDTVVDDETTAVIGSDAASTIRIVRPGISRRHAVVSHTPSGWKIEDAGSRNGSYRFGQRFESVAINGTETVYLGHPTDGEKLMLSPTGTTSDTPIDDDPVLETFILPEKHPEEKHPEEKHPEDGEAKAAPAPSSKPTTPVASDPFVPPAPAMTPEAAAARSRAQRAPREVELAELTNALRDQINAVKGLTWSVWAMIAVTAALAVMTLFVGILGS
jgi:pSer/pThr/pTyr-binding forkhead associated (FHA) protein